MGYAETIWSDPVDFLRATAPDHPVLLLSPGALQAQAQRFLAGFAGLVTYAVKANPDDSVITNLAAAGITGFDVASPGEIALIRRLVPDAALHYNNPVRTRAEIAFAVAQGVTSYSVDAQSELDKLLALVPAGGTEANPVEIAVRFKLPVAGASYDFGAKFGADEGQAATLLRRVAAQGFSPALTFHPGTQCVDPQAWVAYIRAAARIADAAGVRIARLNVGGGFPSHRMQTRAPSIETILAVINQTTAEVFGDTAPALVCEPGRALVADSFALLVRIKAIRDNDHVFLNDGIYGAFSEQPLVAATDRLTAWSPRGTERRGTARARTVFGPTCDSIDRLPGEIPLPGDIEDGDYLLVQGMGAYSAVTSTRFNGFGALALQLVLDLHA